MLRLLLITSAAVFISGCASQYTAHELQRQPPTSPSPSTSNISAESPSVDGVYRFVSRTTIVTSPEQSTEQLTDAEWKGLWVFQDGYFSQTRMKINRAEWSPGQFPSDARGVGFDGASGTYVVKGDTIELKHIVSFYPNRTGDVEDLKYHLENDTLTLTEQMRPHTESLATGQRITVLQRIK